MRTSRWVMFVVSSVALLATAAPAAAGTAYSWNASSSASWSVAESWLPATDYPRLADDTAAVPEGMGKVLLSGAFSIDSLTLAAGAIPGTLRLAGNSLSLLGAAGLNNNGLVEANVTTSTNTLAGAMTLGATGEFRVWGGATLSLRKRAASAALALANDGTITVNSNASTTAVATLRFDDDAALSGTGKIVLNQSTTIPLALLDTGGTALLTQMAGHTISGQGEIAARLDNRGTISADAAGKELKIAGAAKTKDNSGTVQAVAGGILRIDGLTFNQTSTGVILADGAGSMALLNTAVVSGGTLRTANGGAVVANQANLTNVTNQGTLNVPTGATAWLQGTATNYGTIVVHSDDYAGPATLDIYDTMTLGGAGKVDMRMAGAAVVIEPARVLTQAAGHTIRGQGTISGGTASGLNNLGTVEAVGGTLTVSCPIAQLPGATLTGGTWIVRAGATLSITTGGAGITTNQGSVVLDGAGSQFAKINALNNNQGQFSVQGGRKFTTSGALLNTGAITIGGAGSELSVSGGLSGTGNTDVAGGASLTANSIVQNTLTIGAGGSVTIRETPFAAAGGAAEASAVPEPGAIALLLPLAAAGGAAWGARRSRRNE